MVSGRTISVQGRLKASDVAAVFLAVVLLAAAVGKLGDPDAGAGAITAAVGLESSGAAWLSRSAIVAELLLAAWLISGMYSRMAFAVTAAFLVAATAFLLRLLAVDHQGPCGCGLPTVDGALGLWLGVARNAALLVVILAAWPAARAPYGNLDSKRLEKL